MFFIEALLVPPTKFRPATKGGDNVSALFMSGYLATLETGQSPFYPVLQLMALWKVYPLNKVVKLCAL